MLASTPKEAIAISVGTTNDTEDGSGTVLMLTEMSADLAAEGYERGGQLTV
jgi:hypothetical protein